MVGAEAVQEVYRTDAAAKRFPLSDKQRLHLHQRRNRPVMEELHPGLTEQVEQTRTSSPNTRR